MTVQEIGDEFTVLSHQGKAQAKVVHVSGGEVKNVTGIEMIGDDIALIKSETIRNQDAESAEIINEKLKIDVWKFVEKKNPDYKKDVIKHQTLVSLLIEFTKKREEELKANFDYFIEGKDLEIKTLGERCNQLLKDKGDLTDRLAEEVELHLHTEEYIKSLEEENNKLLDVINNQDVKIVDLEKENEELKETLKTYNGCGDWDNDFHACRVYLQHEELQMYIDQLTNAKEVIKSSIVLLTKPRTALDTKTYLMKAEQFLKENGGKK